MKPHTAVSGVNAAGGFCSGGGASGADMSSARQQRGVYFFFFGGSGVMEGGTVFGFGLSSSASGKVISLSTCNTCDSTWNFR